MSLLRSIRILNLFSVFLVLTALPLAYSADHQVVAVIGGEQITKNDLDDEVAEYGKSGDFQAKLLTLTPEGKKKILDNLVKERLFNEYEGAFVENYVAQQIISHFSQKLFYWRSKGGKAELDFLCEFADHIFPLEVKAGINLRSKSLKSYDAQFKPAKLVRTTLRKFKIDGKVCNLPLYAVSLFPALFGKDV